MTVFGEPVEIALGTILLATDFSPSAETAGLYVECLAARYRSLIRLIHVVDRDAAFKTPNASVSIEIFRRSAEESLNRLRNRLASSIINVETILSESSGPAQEILQAAKDKSVDLLAIGTRAHKGLTRLVLGSTAELLIHRAKCPVLTIGPQVRPPEGPLKIRNMVYATDFSVEAASACVFALSFAQDFGAHIYLCHVLPAPHGNPQMDGQELNERFACALQRFVPDVAREWCEPECVVEHGHAADGILLLARRVKADLIVLGTRLTSHWFDNFKTGVAFQVISGAYCPALTIRG